MFRLAARLFFVMFLVTFTNCSYFQALNKTQSQLDKLRSELDYVFNDPAFAEAHWGVVVQSLKNGEYFYVKNPHKNFIPASNMKLFTTATALAKLGPEHRFKTRFYQKGQVDESGILHGDLIIAGQGDPTITGRYFKGEISKPFELWADSLLARNIKMIDGNIIGDDNYFEEEILGEGWAWDYESDWYAAQISALSFNDNCMDIYIVPGDSLNTPSKFHLVPETNYVQIKNKILTVRKGLEKEITFHRKPGTNNVELRGAIAIDSPPKRDRFSIENPTLFTVTIFKQVLEKRGITVAGQAYDIDDVPDYSYLQLPENIIFEHSSAPLWEIIDAINKMSQNLYAEILLRSLGAYFLGVGDAKHGIEVVKEFLQGIGIKTDQFLMYDGSGLSRLNMVTPTQITMLLKFMRKHENGSYFYDSLPIAGVDGTIINRMQQTSAHGNVRAKTGYVGHVRSLSGYLSTADKEELAFSIIANNYSAPTSMANLIQDLVCERLANFSRVP